MELVERPNGLQGVALNLEEDNVGVVIMGPDVDISTRARGFGEPVALLRCRQGEALSGEEYRQSVGPADDGKGEIPTTRYRTIETSPRPVVQRQPVKQPLQTGIRTIDAADPDGQGAA